MGNAEVRTKSGAASCIMQVSGSGPVSSGKHLGAVEFSIQLKGWRSQLRWALTQRKEDPARVWLEVISIDERSKLALSQTVDPAQEAELRQFRDKLEGAMASLGQELGDDTVAPLYSWLDLVRERLRLGMKIEAARAAVVQARVMRSLEAAFAPLSEDDAAEHHARAQADLESWRNALPPAPSSAARAWWKAAGGDALKETLSRDPMEVGKRGAEALRVLRSSRALHALVRSGYAGSKTEQIVVPTLASASLVAALFGWIGTSACLLAAAALLIGAGVLARRRARREREASIQWVWHHALYGERVKQAEMEAGWLRALVDALRAMRTFDAKAGQAGRLREYEAWRPDLSEIVHEVAREATADITV